MTSCRQRLYARVTIRESIQHISKYPERQSIETPCNRTVIRLAAHDALMKKVRPVVARNSRELAKVLGLSPADGMEIEFRSDLNDKIIEVVAKKGLTHSDVARLAHTSRTRAIAILNRNNHDISIDLMLRVLASLGVQAKLQFKNAA